jgi:hypothetical protein
MDAADDLSQESCRVYGKKLDGINEFAEHVTTEHPIRDNNKLTMKILNIGGYV